MPTMKIEVDITKPPKEEAARIEKLLTDLRAKDNAISHSQDFEGSPHFKVCGILKDILGDQDPVELQKKWRSEWD